MNYDIREVGNYHENEILPLYQKVGWINYTKNPAMLKQAYEHSLKIYGAYVKEQLVGVIRVVGDGYSVVFVQDLLVDPEFQRQGIGRELLRKIMQEYGHVYQIHLLTDHTQRSIGFYKSMGFCMDTEINCVAFSRYVVGE